MSGMWDNQQDQDNPTDSGRDILGNIPQDIQGNPTDRDVHGNRPEDIQGNEPKDIYGNPVSS